MRSTRRRWHVVLTAVFFSAATLASWGQSQPSTSSQGAPSTKADRVVWVNTDSGVYHKPGSHLYGKTKHGKYMTEADAIKAGYHASEKK